MAKPRVYVVIGTFYPILGGAEAQALMHARCLRSRGHEAKVVTLRHEKSWRQFDTIEGVPVMRVAGGVAGGRQRLPGVLRKGAYLAGVFILGWELWRRRREYDIVNLYELHVLTLPVALACLVARKPLLASPRISGLAANSAKASGRKSEVAIFRDVPEPIPHLTLGLLRCVGAVLIALSSRIESEIAAQNTRLAVVRIPNGVDTSRFVPAAPDLDPEGRARVAIFAGRLTHQKGIDVLLAAWRSVQDRVPRARLLIVGSGPLEGELKRLAEKLGVASSVEFTGLRRDMLAQLHRAGLSVLPSRWEGMPNAVLEAMACGLPCVATRVSGSEELIQSGVNGILVEPEDVTALGQALRTLLEDPSLAREYGRAARATVERCYSQERIMDVYEGLYDRLAGGVAVGSTWPIGQPGGREGEARGHLD
jgi:glycosyltransferase involved in cell wall biosynthesis